MEFCYLLKVTSALLIIVGTFILSFSIFLQNIKFLVNIKYNELPLYFKGIISLLFLKKDYKSSRLWMLTSEDYAPTKEVFSNKQKVRMLLPFIGFILVAMGTALAVF
jgi:hypothetical protein